MKAKELLNEYVKEEELDKCSVIAISQDKDYMHWHHVHLDEEIPVEGYDIAIAVSPKNETDDEQEARENTEDYLAEHPDEEVPDLTDDEKEKKPAEKEEIAKEE